jgi:hypothetical protein
VYTIREDSHSQGGGPSVGVGGAAAARGAAGDSRVVHGATGVVVAAHGVAGDTWATGGTVGIVKAARGRNPSWTAGAGREATGGSKP